MLILLVHNLPKPTYSNATHVTLAGKFFRNRVAVLYLALSGVSHRLRPHMGTVDYLCIDSLGTARPISNDEFQDRGIL